jgi:hypothetical protein
MKKFISYIIIYYPLNLIISFSTYYNNTIYLINYNMIFPIYYLSKLLIYFYYYLKSKPLFFIFFSLLNYYFKYINTYYYLLLIDLKITLKISYLN